MSSDSETGPSPLPSPIFARCSPARGTVARKCREFYLKRLERTANMQKRWSICDLPQDSSAILQTETTDPILRNGNKDLTIIKDHQTASENNVPEQDCHTSNNEIPGEHDGQVNVNESSLTSKSESGVILDNGCQTDASHTVNDDVLNNTCHIPKSDDAAKTSVKNSDFQTFEGYPLRKCRSSFDLAMDSLRKEISSLIAQDNDLFRQLLSLHDSIAELRERQRHSAALCMDDDDEDDIEFVEDDECPRRSPSPSLESLSDPGESPETSPESTLSSRSSLSSHRCSNRYRKRDVTKQRNRATSNRDSRPLVFVDKSEVCFRCRKMAPPYRRASSITSLYYLHEDMESYDSGIHLQGSHSDSDHEIFV